MQTATALGCPRAGLERARGASRSRRAALLSALAALASTALVPGAAHAAALRLQAPEGCSSTDTITAQVEKLTRRPLHEVDGVDFEVEIVARDAGDYLLRLRTLSRDPAQAPRTREIRADSCEQVGEAAAVAIAMAITGEEPPPEPEPAAEQSRVAPAKPAPSPKREPPRAPADTGPSPWRASIAAGVALDGSVLPSIAPAAQLELAGAYRALALRLYGNAFVPQEARASGLDAGASFGLLLGGALACGEARFGDVGMLACGGGELGSLYAQGRDLDVSSGSQSTLFAALRGDLGARLFVLPTVSLLVRIGACLPLRRDPFQINDGAITLHRAGAFSVRGSLEAELELF